MPGTHQHTAAPLIVAPLFVATAGGRRQDNPPGLQEWQPAPSSERQPTQIGPVRQQQLASDIIGLISTLDRKLDGYLAVQSGRPLEESSKLINDSAVVWIQQTLEDLAATVVGIEVASTTPGGPANL